jgi:hypothetical protein
MNQRRRLFFVLRHPIETYRRILVLLKNGSRSNYDLTSMTIHYKLLSSLSKKKFPSIKPIKRVTWVCLPGSPEGGGITTISRFIKAFNEVGVDQEILVWSEDGIVDLESQKRSLIEGLGIPASIPIRSFNESLTPDLVIATGWQTFAPAASLAPKERRVVFLQDKESAFEPYGDLAIYFEASLPLFEYAICCGPWLVEEATSHGIKNVSFFEFGVDPVYFHGSFARKKEIVVYFQPDKARRMAKLAIASVTLALDKLPGWTAILVGSNSEIKLLPKIKNFGIQNKLGLSNLYRRASIGIALSATNGSLVPPEMAACGLHVISNDGPNVKWLDPNASLIEFVNPDPTSISQSIINFAKDEHYRERKESRYRSWDDSIEIWKQHFLRSHKRTDLAIFLEKYL